MIHIYTGDGKGKTTAAVGLAVRYAGNGKKVEFFQFLKDGTSCENACLNKLNIKVTPCQRTKGFFWEMNEEEKKKLKEETCLGFECAEKLCETDCDMIILDEILGAVENGLIGTECLLKFLKTYGEKKEIVLTGRNLPAQIEKIADYVSHITGVKHPYEQGKTATKGIEF